MKGKSYIYPAVFTPEGGIYSIIFPDLGIATSGDTVDEAMKMAKDALCLTLFDMEEHGEEIPDPSDVNDILLNSGSFIRLIECSTAEYRTC